MFVHGAAAESVELDGVGEEQVRRVAADEFDRLAHDLRSPLAVVLSFAEYLPDAEPQERERLCARILANTRRALEVLEEFGLLRDLRVGAAEMELEAEDLAGILAAATSAVAAQSVSGGQRMEVACSGTFILPCDRLKVLTALRGFVRHLVRRVARDSSLHLSLWAARGWVNIDIRLANLEHDVESDIETIEMELLRRVVDLHHGRVAMPREERSPLIRVSFPAAQPV
jgi:signal transduction histidine kinase